MSKILQNISGVLLVVVIGISMKNAGAENNVQNTIKSFDAAAPLPAVLDNYFPPKAQAPIFLFAMHGMSRPFSGIMVDLFENDVENVMANYENFRQQYAEVSKLVPEWQEYFPAEPVDELGAALKSGDQGKVMAAIDYVGMVCDNCHFTNMPKVHAKYHWPKFHDIKITDPLSKEQISFSRLMQYLEVNFTGIGINLEQGQTGNAKKQLAAFRARFASMEETCMNCHDSDRYYYVDESVQKLIDELEQALNAIPVDVPKVEKYSQAIGMENCFKCHLVHVPAAAQQIRMMQSH